MNCQRPCCCFFDLTANTQQLAKLYGMLGACLTWDKKKNRESHFIPSLLATLARKEAPNLFRPALQTHRNVTLHALHQFGLHGRERMGERDRRDAASFGSDGSLPRCSWD